MPRVDTCNAFAVMDADNEGKSDNEDLWPDIFVSLKKNGGTEIARKIIRKLTLQRKIFWFKLVSLY